MKTSEIREELVAQYGGNDLPMLEVCRAYFGIRDEKTARRRAAAGTLPVPAYRLGGRKSPWFIAAQDLAELLAEKRAGAWYLVREDPLPSA